MHLSHMLRGVIKRHDALITGTEHINIVLVQTESKTGAYYIIQNDTKVILY